MQLECQAEDGRHALVIDANERVAYAYLLIDGEINADVWLYNCGPAPTAPEWDDPDKMPCANPAKWMVKEDFEIPTDESAFSVLWEKPEDEVRAVLLIHEQVHAVLERDARPGWCRLAKKPSPIARPLAHLED